LIKLTKWSIKCWQRCSSHTRHRLCGPDASGIR